jgi:hypothetical protein
MSRIYLSFPAGPNLPVAPGEWNEQFQNQFSNILRLYFNQLSGLLRELGNTQGGYHLNFPYGAFHQDGVTTLSANITNVSTTPISVASTAGFPASGRILIGDEIIQYTATTSTTFAGTITRGVLGTTNVAHNSGDAVSEVQGTGSSTTIGQVLFNNTDYSNGIYTRISDYSKIYFDKDGIYNIQISVQLLNFTTSEDNVTMWFALNGNNLDNTASIEQVNSKHGSNPGAAILTFNIFQQVRGGDYIQIKWTSNSGNTVVATYPAGTSPVHPVSPAIILTASFVSSAVA